MCGEDEDECNGVIRVFVECPPRTDSWKRTLLSALPERLLDLLKFAMTNDKKLKWKLSKAKRRRAVTSNQGVSATSDHALDSDFVISQMVAMIKYLVGLSSGSDCTGAGDIQT